MSKKVERAKRPTRLKLAHHTFSVQNGPKEYMDDRGLAVYEEERIVIREGLSLHTDQEVLVHEILHVLLDELKLDDEFKSDSLEERICAHVGVGLSAAIRDNPGLGPFLQRRK